MEFDPDAIGAYRQAGTIFALKTRIVKKQVEMRIK